MKIIKVKIGETVHINEQVFIELKSIGRGSVRLGFNADPRITIALWKGNHNGNGNSR